MRMVVDFPAPLGPRKTHDLPLGDRKTDVVHRRHTGARFHEVGDSDRGWKLVCDGYHGLEETALSDLSLIQVSLLKCDFARPERCARRALATQKEGPSSSMPTTVPDAGRPASSTVARLPRRTSKRFHRSANDFCAHRR